MTKLDRMVTFRMPEEEYRRVKASAADNGITVGQCIRNCLHQTPLQKRMENMIDELETIAEKLGPGDGVKHHAEVRREDPPKVAGAYINGT